MRTATSTSETLPETYKGLLARFMLRPIHDEVDLENARRILDVLAVRSILNEDQQDYLEVLSILVEQYERENDPIDVSDITGLDALRYLLEQNNMTASDLGRLLGNRQLGPKILNGERQLSKRHIKTLCERFSVSADLFLG